MIRPYEPGKIPIVFVHGLLSSPRAWVQTINELGIRRRSPRGISSGYSSIRPACRSPPRRDGCVSRWCGSATRSTRVAPTAPLDRMVVVGHSMGGVLSKMMAQSSGSALWDAAITSPGRRFRAPPELRKSLDELLVFEPLPFVRRVVFVATPHRGSPIANGPVGWAVSRLVRGPNEQAARVADHRGPERTRRGFTGAPRPCAQCHRQPANRQPDPGRARPDADRSGGALPLDHPPDRCRDRVPTVWSNIEARVSRVRSRSRLSRVRTSLSRRPRSPASSGRILLEHLDAESPDDRIAGDNDRIIK